VPPDADTEKLNVPFVPGFVGNVKSPVHEYCGAAGFSTFPPVPAPLVAPAGVVFALFAFEAGAEPLAARAPVAAGLDSECPPLVSATAGADGAGGKLGPWSCASDRCTFPAAKMKKKQTAAIRVMSIWAFPPEKRGFWADAQYAYFRQGATLLSIPLLVWI